MPLSSGPGSSLSADVDQHYLFQGRSIDEAEARLIDDQQRAFVHGALSAGLKDLHEFENDNDIPEVLRGLFTALTNFANEIKSRSSFREGPGFFYSMANRFPAYYALINEERASGHIDDQQALFFQFLLGLLRFDLAGRMSVHLMEQIFDRDIDVAEMATSMALIPARKGLIKGLGQSAASIERISAVYMAKFAESPEQFWQLISSHLSDNFELDEAAKSLASLHGTEVSDGFTTMAQVLHWNGFGGNAEWLEEFDDFKFLLPHAISYHGESGRGGHFNQRMSLFGGILAPLKDHGLKTLAAYINQRMNKSRVRVYDVGSGRNAQGVSGAAEYIDGGKRLDITVADVTGSLLLEMARLRDSGKKAGKGWWIEDVRYQDLTGDLSGDSEANQYDVFSASLVLHQLMDKDSGDLEVAKVMKFASTLVRPEGVIHLPSVGEAAYLQSPVNPANLVDKEGCLPANLMERLSFKDVMTTAGAGGRFKVPYPLLRLQKHTPEGLYDDKGIYQYSLYILVAISFPDLLQLEEFKQQGRWDLCDVVISRYLDIGKIQEEVLAAVEQV